MSEHVKEQWANYNKYRKECWEQHKSDLTSEQKDLQKRERTIERAFLKCSDPDEAKALRGEYRQVTDVLTKLYHKNTPQEAI